MNIGLGFALMPVLFRHLSKEELGVWLLLGQSGAVLGVFDLGFGTVLTRRIAFALGKSEGAAAGEWTPDAAREIAGLVGTGRRVYGWLAFSAFVISFGSGWYYLGGLPLRESSYEMIWAAWGVLCLGQSLGIRAATWTCLLQGLGYVGWDLVLCTLVNTMVLSAQILLVLLGGGVLGLAMAAAAGTVVQRWLIFRLARNRRAQLVDLPAQYRPELLRGMLSPALRAWLTSLGCLLVANTDPFFIAARQGAAAIPAYRAAFLLLLNLHLLAGVFCAPSQVFVSGLWQAGALPQIHAILKGNARFGLLAMGCGGGAILALGPALFDFWIGPGNFVGYPILGIFLAMFALEHHANVFSSCARATEDEAYALSSLAAGVLKLGLAYILSRWLGLAGLALSTLLAQALTNDWYMVSRSLKRLRVDFADHVRKVVRPCLLVFVVSLLLGRMAVILLANQPLVLRVMAVLMLGGGLLGASMWRLGFGIRKRPHLLQWGKWA